MGNLINHLKQEYVGANSSIKYIAEIDPDIVLDIERYIPCGLILNELITNAVKYAFEPGGVVRSGCHSPIRTIYHMEVSDNGRGMPAEGKSPTGTSLGTELVLQAHSSTQRRDVKRPKGPGTTIIIQFSEKPGERVHS